MKLVFKVVVWVLNFIGVIPLWKHLQEMRMITKIALGWLLFVVTLLTIAGLKLPIRMAAFAFLTIVVVHLGFVTWAWFTFPMWANKFYILGKVKPGRVITVMKGGEVIAFLSNLRKGFFNKLGQFVPYKFSPDGKRLDPENTDQQMGWFEKLTGLVFIGLPPLYSVYSYLFTGLVVTDKKKLVSKSEQAHSIFAENEYGFMIPNAETSDNLSQDITVMARVELEDAYLAQFTRGEGAWITVMENLIMEYISRHNSNLPYASARMNKTWDSLLKNLETEDNAKFVEHVRRDTGFRIKSIEVIGLEPSKGTSEEPISAEEAKEQRLIALMKTKATAEADATLIKKGAEAEGIKMVKSAEALGESGKVREIGKAEAEVQDLKLAVATKNGVSPDVAMVASNLENSNLAVLPNNLGSNKPNPAGTPDPQILLQVQSTTKNTGGIVQ